LPFVVLVYRFENPALPRAVLSPLLGSESAFPITVCKAPPVLRGITYCRYRQALPFFFPLLRLPSPLMQCSTPAMIPCPVKWQYVLFCSPSFVRSPSSPFPVGPWKVKNPSFLRAAGDFRVGELLFPTRCFPFPSAWHLLVQILFL